MVDKNEMEQLRANEWYQTRPEIIKIAIELCPPLQHYRIKKTGAQCYILSYEEPESNSILDVTVTVQKTGVGTFIPDFNQSQVFGIPLNDIEPWDNPN